jgi:hypothetical protein
VTDLATVAGNLFECVTVAEHRRHTVVNWRENFVWFGGDNGLGAKHAQQDTATTRIAKRAVFFMPALFVNLFSTNTEAEKSSISAEWKPDLSREKKLNFSAGLN